MIVESFHQLYFCLGARFIAMKLSKKTRRLMAASVGASALLACATTVAQEPVPQIVPPLTQQPNAGAPPLRQEFPQGPLGGLQGRSPLAEVPQCETPPMAKQKQLTELDLNSIFKAADANNDGALSAIEFQSAYKKIVEATTPKAVLPPDAIEAPGFACPGCGMG